MNHYSANAHRAQALEHVAAVQAAEHSIQTLRNDRALKRIDAATFDRRRRRVEHEVHVGLKLAQIHAQLAAAEETALLREALMVRGTGVTL